eukprot:Rhum_TRINITY_DN3724_c0_g1::Rhum_TRINITY_DN3724_c0_g1_i1::g.11860::m.11860
MEESDPIAPEVADRNRRMCDASHVADVSSSVRSEVASLSFQRRPLQKVVVSAMVVVFTLSLVSLVVTANVTNLPGGRFALAGLSAALCAYTGVLGFASWRDVSALCGEVWIVGVLVLLAPLDMVSTDLDLLPLMTAFASLLTLFPFSWLTFSAYPALSLFATGKALRLLPHDTVQSLLTFGTQQLTLHTLAGVFYLHGRRARQLVHDIPERSTSHNPLLRPVTSQCPPDVVSQHGTPTGADPDTGTIASADNVFGSLVGSETAQSPDFSGDVCAPEPARQPARLTSKPPCLSLSLSPSPSPAPSPTQKRENKSSAEIPVLEIKIPSTPHLDNPSTLSGALKAPEYTSSVTLSSTWTATPQLEGGTRSPADVPRLLAFPSVLQRTPRAAET